MEEIKPLEDMKAVMRRNYLQYASYVILDRAIPNVIDGLKPVQRRILYTLWSMHDGKLHKVANVAGQTMAYHPHGDAPITEALVNMANKGYLLDKQGNFGNLYTGDPAAASRYIETRLSPLAKETLFNAELTQFLPSYDGRKQEPICLPSKIPTLLMQGADGIAVGMSTHILPHNFVELLEAQIAILEGKSFTLLPDFLTGGIMDASDYQKGKGKVKLRAKTETRDPKTLAITEICHGTTTESLIRSIDEAAKKGKIKIEAIHDYTAERVDIEIKLPRGQYAQDLLDALYAYTECEVSLSSQVVVIKDNMPWETDVHEILRLNTQKLLEYLEQELNLEKSRLTQKIFEKTLERIFIEERIYKNIENLNSYEEIHQAIAKGLRPFESKLSRVPSYEDRETLLNIPIRRISRFDVEKNQEEIQALGEALQKIEKELKNVQKHAIVYLRGLIKKYGKEFPRRTQIQAIEQIDKRAIQTKALRVGFDPKTGFVGTKVTSDISIECTNFDKLLVLYKEGTYMVINIPEKQYLLQEGNKPVYVGIADKKTVISLAYRDKRTHLCYGKRFVVSSFILEKSYRYFEEDMELLCLSTQPFILLELQLIPKLRQKHSKEEVELTSLLVKGSSAKGVRLSPREVKKATILKQGETGAASTAS